MVIKIVHLINTLDAGGAEKMLYKLINYTDKKKHNVEVISLTDLGKYGPALIEKGIKVHTLNMRRGFPSFKAIYKARKIVNGKDILQSWMYHSDLLALILYKTTSVKKLIWGIRNSDLSPDNNKKSTLFIAKVNSIFSKIPDLVISCSQEGIKTHTKYGYNSINMALIPNGFELEDNINNQIESKMIFNEEKKTIIHVGRWDKLKDHETFFHSIKELSKIRNDFNIILCGIGINDDNKELVKLIEKYGVKEYITLLGERNDVPDLLRISKVFVSSSIGEGFSNVIGEAMISGTLCVVTDVGDSAYIVGDTGIIVKPKDYITMSKAIDEILNMKVTDYNLKSKKAKLRINENFDIKKIANQYENHYEELVKKG